MKVYVASSWRNWRQLPVVKGLKAAGHEVYDFRNPSPDDHGFQWSEIDPNWMKWNLAEYVLALQHRIADKGFTLDMSALKWCEVCVLVMPCGRSAHLELGWAAGAGKKTIIMLTEEGFEPELMYKMVDKIVLGMDGVMLAMKEFQS